MSREIRSILASARASGANTETAPATGLSPDARARRRAHTATTWRRPAATLRAW